MPGKQARALCPVCQEPMPPDETECGNCGAFVIDEAVVRLSRAFGIPREKALALFDKGFRHPRQLQDRDVDQVLAGSEDGLLYICTNCGSFVSAGETRCLRCGAEFEGEETPPLREKDILDIVLCPVCGADNDPSWKECEICGEPLGGTEEVPEVPFESAGRSPVPSPEAEPEDEWESGPALERFDEFLDDPWQSAGQRPVKASPRVSRVPKVARPTSPRTRAGPRLSAGTKGLRPRPRTFVRLPHDQRPTLPRSSRVGPGPRAPPRAGPRPPRSLPPPRYATRTPPPPPRRRGTRRPSDHPLVPDDFLGGALVASGLGLALGTPALGTGLAWIVAFAVAVLTAYGLGLWTLVPQDRVPRWELGLLSLGSALGASAIALPTGLLPLASLAGAGCIALTVRHLLPLPSRTLVAAAVGAPLVALALAAAVGMNSAGTLEWIAAIALSLPWPAGVAAYGLRARRAASDLRREVVEADRQMERRDYGRSLQSYERATRVAAKGLPGEDLPWYGKGATLVLLGRYEEALRAIDTALDLNPRNEVAWVNKGNALTKIGRLPDALRCFNAALKVNPNYEVAWNNRGNTLARMGRYEDALLCYERALRIDPGYRGAWVNKGYVLTKLGRYEEASTCADRALKASERRRAGPA